MPEIVFFKTQKAFRKWLEKNHNKLSEQWVGFYKKNTGKKSIDWSQSVDEALCFGWIDGIRKTNDDDSYKIRFTPRKPQSNWSTINLKKMDELIKNGLVKPEGLKIYSMRKPEKTGVYSYTNRPAGLEEHYEKIMKKNKKAWDFFCSQPPSYRRTASWWVLSAKREETRMKRLSVLIEDSENERRIALASQLKKNN
jgi:uncharacterized protein YdeI (YjbR/CyaY-like superfamily)